MKHWKMPREDTINLAASFLMALPLWFALLKFWPEQPEQTLGYYLRDWAFYGVMLFCFGVARAIRLCAAHDRSAEPRFKGAQSKC